MFRKFLRKYILNFKYGVVKYETLRSFFEEFIKKEMPTEAVNISGQIDWETWVNAPGFPPVQNNFTNKYAKEVEDMVALFYANKLPENFVDIFKGWFTLLKQDFLNRIKNSQKQLTDEQYIYLSDILNLKTGYDVEVSTLYYLIILGLGKTLREDIIDNFVDFLGKHGRINYIRPLYNAFYKRDKKKALETLNKYRNFYHATIIKYIELDFKALG